MPCQYCNCKTDKRFCSISHARAWSASHQSPELRKRKSELAKARNKGRKFGKPFQKGYDPNRKILTDQDRVKAVIALRFAMKVRYDDLAFDDLPHAEKRRRVLSEQSNACTCGIKKWMGKPIVLEFHHKRLDKRERREDVEMLCPNCHSQTSDYRNKSSFE